MSAYSKYWTVTTTIAFALFAMELHAQQRTTTQHEGYASSSAAVATGNAPGMKFRLLAENDRVKQYAIMLAKGDEVMSGLTDFRQNKVASASFTAIGAFSNATVTWFDNSKKEFKLNPINEQVELTSMIGNIRLVNGQPAVHTHMSVASSDGTVRSGHVISAFVFPTLELFMTVYPTALRKEGDAATGLMLIQPAVK
jgi:predicted DNA-binding protein with PD1-like motif